MATSYKKYLAERVFSEQEHVTYRALSRALKVHCNTAKRMLYEFHRLENSKKAGSVHATYVVIGAPVPQVQSKSRSKDADNDEFMQSSPYVGSQLEPEDSDEESIPVTAVRLVREQELSDVKNQVQISSIFVYSVQSTSPPDLNVLADLGHTILESRPEDPLTSGPKYGMIQNKNVKRRTGGAPPPVTKSVAEPAKPKAGKPSATLSQPVNQGETLQKEPPAKQDKPMVEAESISRPVSQQSTKSQSQSKASEKPQLKRDASSIFKAFAKAKPKQKKEPTEAPAPEPEKPKEQEDVVMGDDSEGEEDTELFVDSKSRSNDKSRETRKEREEKLKKMMEDDEDEDMPDAPPETDESPAPEKSLTAEEIPAKEEQPKVETTVDSSGRRRRRGRRQVMKKKVVKDKEGYLITKEEPVWESFSEDEPEPPKKQPPVSVKPAKGPAKGQGSIMSFFKKQ